jgi:hypothetical protein
MQGPLTRWGKTENRKGVFGDYTVLGFKYHNANGQIGWHITAWLSGFDPVHDYWVTGRNFHSVSIHYMYKGTPYNLIEIYEPPITTEIVQAEQDAVLQAIAQWEKPEAA